MASQKISEHLKYFSFRYAEKLDVYSNHAREYFNTKCLLQF